MFRTKSFRVAGLVMILMALGSSLKAWTPNIDGNYVCNGTNPGNTGSGYTGTVSISRAGSTYLMRWHIGRDTFTGLGILKGDTLSVSWYSAGKTGVVVYQVLQEGDSDVSLKGVWASLGGNGQLGTETLVR
jgi:hypothetical protein